MHIMKPIMFSIKYREYTLQIMNGKDMHKKMTVVLLGNDMRKTFNG